MIKQIPEKVSKKWQTIVNLLAQTSNVPAALIMKQNPPEIEVFKSSNTPHNPYEAGDTEKLNGLYCERVIGSQEKLLVSNALKDKEWKDNPDIELGMISYLGYPIKLPDGEIFGTICILDTKENQYNETTENLMAEFKELIESHLELIEKNEKLKQAQRKQKKAHKRSELYKNLLMHDVNNILQNISMGTEILTDKIQNGIKKEEKINEILEIFNQEVINGENLISNIRLFSEMQNKKMISHPINFFELLERATSGIFKLYSTDKVDIKIFTDLELEDISVHGNKLLFNVINNILLNAIKHNTQEIKKIKIRCSKIRKEDHKYLKVQFIDNGIGIPDNMKKEIFNENYNLERKEKGLGIGLALVQKLLKEFGGKIWVEDRVEADYTQGSKFIILLLIT
ncbi:MAG: GAF domain-containing sensor histidine kinase [Promethearchaeia archaeon]